MTKSSVFIILILGFLVLAALVPVAPNFRPLPGTDSAVYLYVGERVLDGGLPYRDAWDHKGPLIYYLDALALALHSGSRWGVWLLEGVSLSIAALLGYIVLRCAFGRLPALFGSVAWLVSLPAVLDGGNMTEEYALPLAFAALYLFWRAERGHPHTWNEFFIGVLAALSFLLRPNLIGIPLAIALLLAYRAFAGPQKRIAWLRLVSLALGAMVVLLLVGLYFSANAALDDLFGALFTYNLAYAASVDESRWATFFAGLDFLPVLSTLALTGFGVGLYSLRARHESSSEHRTFLSLLLVALPVELALTAVSGRPFMHYYMAWLPVFAMLAGYLAFVFLTEFGSAEEHSNFPVFLVYTLLVAASLLPLSRMLPPLYDMGAAIVQARGVPPVDYDKVRQGEVIRYVLRNTGEDDYLLMWGNEIAINLVTGRPLPGRFLYQAHLFIPGHSEGAMAQEYLNTIMATHPLIIDTTVSEGGVPSLGADLKTVPAYMRPIYAFIMENYELVETVGHDQWPVYRYVGPQGN